MLRTSVLVMMALVGGIAVASAQDASRAVSGRVFDDTTGCPVAGVVLQATGGTARALTNTQGRYRLMSLPAGDVVVQATKAGYRTKQSLPTTVTDSSARIDFSLIRTPGDSGGRAGYPRKACQLEPPDQP
ncbi:MAG: carboxypeptidase regulatory-like domain-containing protein [Gemmatimonadales bacterium]